MTILTPEKFAEIIAQQLDKSFHFETSTWLSATVDVDEPAAAIVYADPDAGPTSRFQLIVKEF